MSQSETGYVVGEFYVDTHPGESQSFMDRETHEYLNHQLYLDGDEQIARVDNPIVVKMETSHFVVGQKEDVPKRTIVLPNDHSEFISKEAPRPVLVAKEDSAMQLAKFFQF